MGHKRLLSLSLCIAALVTALALAWPGQAAAVSYTPEELELVGLINSYRTAQGRSPLLISDLCSDAAEKHSSDMAKYGFTGHVSAKSDWFKAGATWQDRLIACGYTYHTSTSESSAYGPSYTAQALFDALRGSPEHNANLVSASFRVIGVGLVEGGVEGRYWTIDFGGYVDPTAHPVSGSGAHFLDVPLGQSYYAAIQYMADARIIDGYTVTGGREFRPANPVKRAQFAKMLAGALGLQVSEDLASPFSDLGTDDPASYYPHEFVAAAYRAGVIKGKTADTFAPWDDVTRSQAVVMVVRAILTIDATALDRPPADYVNTWGVAYETDQGPLARVAEYNGLLNGLPLTGAAHDPWGAMPRGEVAQVLWNVMQELALE